MIMNNTESSENDDLDWQSSGFYSESKYEFIRQLNNEENQLLQLLEMVREAKNKVELERLALISESAIHSDNTNIQEENLLESSNLLVHEQLSLQPSACTQFGNSSSSISRSSSRCKDHVQRENGTSKLVNESGTFNKPLTDDLCLQLPVRTDSDVDAPSVVENGFHDKNSAKVLRRMVDGHYYCEVSKDWEESSSSESEDMSNVMDFL